MPVGLGGAPEGDSLEDGPGGLELIVSLGLEVLSDGSAARTVHSPYRNSGWSSTTSTRSRRASAAPSMNGAPHSSKGRVVPRPSDRFVPSSRHCPG